jgi:hypothetical protein
MAGSDVGAADIAAPAPQHSRQHQPHAAHRSEDGREQGRQGAPGGKGDGKAGAALRQDVPVAAAPITAGAIQASNVQVVAAAAVSTVPAAVAEAIAVDARTPVGGLPDAVEVPRKSADDGAKEGTPDGGKHGVGGRGRDREKQILRGGRSSVDTHGERSGALGQHE